MKNKILGSSALLVTTMIWGFAFIAQSVGMDQMGPFTFQAIRCLLAFLFLFLAATLADVPRLGLKASLKKWTDPRLLKNGSLCGAVLFLGASLQQIGLVYTDAGKAGFITAMYIVMVPLIGMFTRKKPPVTALISVVPAVIGLYLLSYVGGSPVNMGDIFLMIGALGFAVQILLIDRKAVGLDGLRFNCMQCLVICVLSLPFLLGEEIHPEGITEAWGALIFAGVFSMGIAYSLQIIGQKHVEATAASLIMSLESVFAVLGGWMILGETMTPRELTGCALMFSAVVISQLPVGAILTKKQPEKA